MRKAYGIVAIVAILEPEENIELPSARLLIQLGGHHCGHQKLLAALSVHLFANDLLDLLQDLIAERQVVVDTRANPAYETGAQQELVAHHLRVRRDFS